MAVEYADGQSQIVAMHMSDGIIDAPTSALFWAVAVAAVTII